MMSTSDAWSLPVCGVRPELRLRTVLTAVSQSSYVSVTIKVWQERQNGPVRPLPVYMRTFRGVLVWQVPPSMFGDAARRRTPRATRRLYRLALPWVI